MRVALVRRFCSLARAGAERYCALLGRQLARQGHEVTIVGEGIDSDLLGELRFLPVPVQRATTWTRNLSFAQNCAAIVREQRFDIVHGLSRVHGLDTFRLTDPLQTHWLNVFYRHPAWRRLQRWNPRHRALLSLEQQLYGPSSVRRIVVQSKLDARLLSEYFDVAPERIAHIPNGTDLTQFHPGARAQRAATRESLGVPADMPMLLFAGMDFRRKGLATLLAALPLLKDREVLLVVAGQGEIPRYQQLAHRAGVSRKVRFVGRCSQMAALYAAADLFVLPTIYEPFPNVNLESMACGTPVITSATAGGADLVAPGKTGWLVQDPWSATELADRIDLALGLSQSQREAMSRACVASASEWTIERNATATLALFEDVRREKSAA